MLTVSIPSTAAPGAYMRDVLERGHLAGVLNGAEDKRRDAWRERQRHAAIILAGRYGVGTRRLRALGEIQWVDVETGERVRIVVEDVNS